MKVKVNNNDFKIALDSVLKVVPSKPVLPILGTVKAEAINDKILFTSADLDAFTFIIASIPSDNKILGSAILENPKNIAKAARFFKDEVIIENGSDCIVKSGNKNIKMTNDADANEFPNTPQLTEYKEYKTTQSKLLERIIKIEDAVSKEEAKPILKGFHFNNNDMVSVDGYRMHIAKDNEMNVEKPFTVSGNTINKVKKLLNKKSIDDVNIKVDSKYIVFNFKNGDCDIIITGRLLEGDYVQYNQFIRKEHNFEVFANTKELIESINYLKAVKESKKEPVKLNIADNKMDLILDTESGAYNSDIVAETKIKNNDNLLIGLNIDYVYEALKQVADNTVKMYFHSSNQAVQIQTENEIYFILPIRIKK